MFVADYGGGQTYGSAGCRVSERRCHRPLPSEPDMRVSPHPAQAATRPHVSGAGVTTVIPAWHLYDTHLQPPSFAFTLGPV